MPTFPSAPAVAIIDQNNVLTLSFTPAADATHDPTLYNFWNIITTINAGPPQTVQFPAPVGYTGGSLTFTEILSSGIVTLNQQAFDHSNATLTLLWQTSGVNAARTFPTALTAASTTFSSTSLLLGQTLTVTLNSSYTGADQWQIIWPDNTTSGWLPLAQNVITKSFTTPGAANVIIQTRRNYSAVQFAPPTTLISQITQQIFVVNQQAANTPTTQSGLTGDLGIGGQQGFEIVNATSGTVTPEPWEVIARAVVRDSVTSELKLLIATSRFSNASSLFGTMALDVFPMEGRPRGKELIVPPYELTVTSATETVPVSITTTAFPTLFVGKSVTEALGGPFALTAQNGILPFIWSSIGLPEGLSINASGVLNGTPLELGEFNVTVAVQDSSVPFSIAEQTFLLTVATDLLVEIAPNQFDANLTPLAQLGTTLGVAQVGTPYNVEMQVGNLDPVETGPGGLPPYTWSAPAGAFPTGLTIQTQPNSQFGLISGTPASYNSTTDFNTTYSITIQVTDAIGAKATQTYTMTLKPEALSFGHLNQLTLYPNAKYKLVVPVFGGQSPYTLVSFLVPPSEPGGLYGTPVLVDGQVEIPVIGTLATGTHTFSLQIHDALNNTPSTQPTQFSYAVETEISDVRTTSGYVVNWAHPTDGSWGLNDTSSAGSAVNVPFNVVGNLLGLAVQGFRLNLTAVGNASGSPLVTIYTMRSNPNFAAFVGQVFYIAGFANAFNNGTFTCTASSATTLTLNNTLGVAQAAPAYTLNLSAAAATAGGTTVYTVSGSSYGNGANNALVGATFTVAGFVNSSNNGVFTCSASTSNSLTLVNGAGVVETHAATAVTPLAKALGAVSVPSGQATLSVLPNGVTVAVDPTNLTSGTIFATGSPDVEWSGPPGPNPTTSAGTSAIFRNAEYRVPLAQAENFQLTSVATSVGGSAVYTGTITGGAANFFAGASFIITGFTTAANNNATTPYDSTASLTPFACTASSATTLTLSNASAVAETNTSAIAIETASFQQTSRDYTTLSHSTPAEQTLTQVIANSPSAGQATYLGTITGGATNAFVGFSFTITGFTNTANNGYFLCVASTASQLVLVNANAINETHAGQSAGDIGNITTYTRPYIVGDVVGFNARKPYFDSPDIPSYNGVNAWTAQVLGGSSLPPGLSLDANTSLIYGTLTGTTGQPSVIQYVDASGAVHGTVTINWITFQSSFVLTDNIVDSQIVGTVYSGANAYTAPVPGSLVSASLAYGVLPNGLTITTDGTNIVISGTPTEAGFFDCWFQAQTATQTAFAYHRISTIIPVQVLAIIGWADILNLTGPVLGPVQPFPIPNAIVSANYLNPVSGNHVTLVAQYGDPPYTFSSSPTLPSASIGTNITLSANAVPGVVTAGELSGGPVTSFSPNPATMTFTVTDSLANTANVITSFGSQATALSITPGSIPAITAGQAYSPLVTLTGHGSVLTPFNFTVQAGVLPVGITLTNAGATTATLQGTTIQTGYGTKTVTIRVTDTSNAYADVPYTVTVTNALALKSGVDTEDVITTGDLGFVDSGSVDSITARPNLSFYIVASGVVSTSIAGITVTTNNPAITGTVKTLAGGVAQIQLSGSGFNTTAGAQSLSVTVIDSGVSATQTFTWTVYSDGTMTVKASNATPTRLTTPT